MTYTNGWAELRWVDSMLQFWFRLATCLFHFRKAHINHQTKSSSPSPTSPSPSPYRRQWKAKVFLKWALKTGCEEHDLRYTCDPLKRALSPLSLSVVLLSLERVRPELGSSHYSVERRRGLGWGAVSYVAVMPSAFGDELKILLTIIMRVMTLSLGPSGLGYEWRRRRVDTSRRLRQLGAYTTLHISTS